MKEALAGNTQKEIKNILNRLHDFTIDAEDCIFQLQTAFIYSRSEPLSELKAKINRIKSEEITMTKQLTEIAGNNLDTQKYVAVPGHLSTMAANIEKVSELIDDKNKDRILFSDKAVNEFMFLLQRLSEIVRPVADILLARNVFLSQYVQESQAGFEKTAHEYATFHEDRLIRGQCLPIASSMYIGMLDAVKSVAWHAKEITVKLTG